MNTFLSKPLCTFAVIISAATGLCRAAEPPVDPATTWFQPVLVENADPICGAMLAETRKIFIAGRRWDDARNFSAFENAREDPVNAVPDARMEDDDYQTRQTVTLPDGTRVFVLFEHFNPPSCRGTCDGERVLISDQSISKFAAFDALPSTPGTHPSWRLIKADNGELYAVGIVVEDSALVEEHLQVFRIAAAKQWVRSCDIAVEPRRSRILDDPDAQAALAALDRLKKVANVLAGGSGDCGSMNTPSRWRSALEEHLYEALYRPWALQEIDREHGRQDYSRVQTELTRWSLGGLIQYRAYQPYPSALAAASRAVGDFYVKKNGWPAAPSFALATRAVETAMTYGFGFYDVAVDAGGLAMRRAILERRSMAEVQRIAIDLQQVDRSSTDSILNIAIEYPQALEYLLARGADPNLANGFGKTPLMYAAQYNRIEAARRLLQAGADPNAATIVPDDRCSYTIGTKGMTPLHYAARYASADFIRLLLKNGAITFARSETQGVAEYPLDWFNRYYSSSLSSEKNPNIAASDVADIRAALRVPDTAERTALAARMVAGAETEYAAGRTESAYRQLQVALIAEPKNRKALADLPLIAMKAGHTASALLAAQDAIATLTAPKALAAAWFNMGLLCEQETVRKAVYAGGKSCASDWLQPFLTAWKINATAPRTAKLKSLFKADGSTACIVRTTADVTQRAIVIMGAIATQLRIYVLHPASQPVDPSTITWTYQLVGKKPIVTVPTIVDRAVLDDEAITVLEGKDYGVAPAIGGQTCRAS